MFFRLSSWELWLVIVLVVLLLYNCSEFFELLFAWWNAGLCAFPNNAQLYPR